MSSETFTKESELSLKLFVVLNRALQSIETKVFKDIKSQGLNLSEFAVLELLYNKGDQPIQKIGQKVLLASSSMTYVIDKLEKKQYLTRRACSNDRRVTYATITEKGKSLMDDIFPRHKKAINQIMGGLDSDEKEIMIDQLKKLGYYAQDI